MAQEIELKFIVEKDSVDALRQHLHTLSGEHHAPVQLLNIYYETPDNWLRRHDMGLRIRGASGRYEMTMKIAGRVVGGLHQRPEYNIDISQPELELERFPAEVWPEGELPATLAEQVQPLFSTDFWREKWLVTEGKSRIEIALDLGEVKAGEYQEPICELELELLEGDANDVLKLARRLVNQSGLRQGSLSKAARGYHLAAGNAPRVLKETTILRVAPKASVEQGLEAALELALSQWQYHEELWVRNVKNAKSHVLAAIALVRHTLTLFGQLAEMCVAGGQFGPGIADADDGLAVKLVVRYALVFHPAAIHEAILVLRAEPLGRAQGHLLFCLRHAILLVVPCRI